MASPRLTAGEKETQGIFSFIKSVRKIFFDHKDSLIMILWDGRSWRKDVYTDYKAKREEKKSDQEAREKYYTQKRAMLKALDTLGVLHTFSPNMEADDLAEIYSQKWKGDKITLWSADKDWLQLIDERTDWYDPINNRHCNSTNFQAFTGFRDSEQFVEAKCILGDKDEVPGIKGIGPTTLEKIYDIWPSIFDFLEDVGAEETWLEKYNKAVPKPLKAAYDNPSDFAKEFLFNRKLADLKTPERPPPEGLIKIQMPMDIKGFEDLCHKFAFHSFTRDIEKFTKPFKDNKYVRS